MLRCFEFLKIPLQFTEIIWASTTSLPSTSVANLKTKPIIFLELLACDKDMSLGDVTIVATDKE